MAIDLPLRSMNEEGQLQCWHALENICAGGVTNLGEGLLWGLGELNTSDAPAAAMLLFTDGLANRGMTSTEDLVEAMQTSMADMGRQSRAVFSFGLGVEHNAQMLFSLADAGTGCYYYVDSARAIAPSFADCLGGMLSVVAQDVTLTLCAKEGIMIGDIHADFNVDRNEDNREACIKMRDLSGDAEKQVLFTLAVPAGQESAKALSLVECTLSYIDVVDGIAKSQASMLSVPCLAHGEAHAEVDVFVEAYRCRLLAAKAMEEAAAMLAKASLQEVQNTLSEAIQALEQSPACVSTEAGAQERIVALLADLSECLEGSSNPRTCEKLCSSRAFAHKHQISTRAEGSDYRNELQCNLAEAARREIASLFGEEASHKRPSGYGKKNRSQPMTRTVCNSESRVSLGTDTIHAGAVRIGMRILCRGQPGVVQEVTLSKTGKHGHAKVFFTVLGDDGVKRQDIVPASHDVVLPSD